MALAKSIQRSVTLTSRKPFSNYPAIRAARASSQRATIGMIGDSLTAGFGDNGAGGGGGGSAGAAAAFLRSKSLPRQFSDLLNTNGIPSRCDGFFAHIGVNNDIIELNTEYNAKVSFDGAGTWATVTSSNNPDANTAGGFWVRNTTTVDKMYFSPVVAANKFDIYYEYFSSGGGNVTVTDNVGTTIATINNVNASPTQMGKITVTKTNTDTTSIRIFASSAGISVGVFAIIPYDSANPMVEIWNLGRGGWKASDWLANLNYFSPGKAYVQLAPLSYIIALGANDWGLATLAAATFQTNLQSMITPIRASSDVRLIKQHGPVTRNGTGYDQPAAYRTAIDTLTLVNGLKQPLNFYDSITLSNSPDYYDAIHLTQVGYSKEAALLLADALVST